MTVTQSLEQVHWQRFQVPFEFPVYFTDGFLDPGNPVLADAVSRLEPARRHRLMVFVDDGIVHARPDFLERLDEYARLNAARMELAAEPVLIPGGEVIKKDLSFVERMQRALYDHHIDRHSFAIGIGGGAVLDAVGLVAATTHRGVRHVRIPTTVLAQNDSGVGVKNGVNLFEQKNFVGTFAPPFAVINDIEFIDHLHARDRIAGMAEAVKVALIRDGEFFRWLERSADALVLFERPAMTRMIRRCAELHMHQIGHGGDPFETGSARPLDYGHWAAHKLEALSNHHLRHGEAVAIGIALDARYSVLAGLLREGEEQRICYLLEHLGFRLWHGALDTRGRDGELQVLRGLQDFREHLGGELTITLLADIGHGVEVHEMDEALVRESIEWLRQREAR
jgi:3-dehydroquinate synthase